MNALAARSRTAWTRYRAYHRTLAELRDLPTRTLSDLGMSRDQLSTIAHREIYGS